MGRFIRKSGDLYEGLIKDGKAEGKGVLVDLRGYRYVGYWKQDMRQGHGDELFPSKGTYKGEFLFNSTTGKAPLTYPMEVFTKANFSKANLTVSVILRGIQGRSTTASGMRTKSTVRGGTRMGEYTKGTFLMMCRMVSGSLTRKMDES